ncbi:VOC family protein [Pseudonocardia sp. DSM 110487]|uniref:VOC family protein n=1 Tax=Pseudonocardia sp. DSM 110487 TaxID=2865833 RepID=UPI001C6A263C|nr:VOC family protein [Pseudonocardia sp. DSM 110487]QYN33057.1 VOC family protein [Pseudonocardia sp. DSM 110487]
MAENNALNTVAWFQIGTEDPAAAHEFYGGLFGWSFAPDPSSGPGYDLISYAGTERPAGGVMSTAGGADNHATFLVLVEDVAAVCTRTEQLGGKVLNPPVTTPNGLVFADLLDRSGNRFGVFTPPSA